MRIPSKFTPIIDIERKELKYLLDLMVAAYYFRHNLTDNDMKEMFCKTVDWVDRWYWGDNDGGETPERLIKRYYDKWARKVNLDYPPAFKDRM